MKILILLVINFLLVGCVETLEKNLPPVSNTQDPVPELVNYPGVLKATNKTGPGSRAISDTRIEVYFPPAAGGSGKFIYEIYIGSTEKYSFTTETLESSKVGGYYSVTIPNREILSKNAVRVEVIDQLLFAKSDTKNTIELTTFGNEVCQFDGIASVSNLAGAEGKDSLRVKWVPAVWTGVSAPSTPIYYEVTLLENGIERDRIHDPTLGESSGRIVRTAQFIDGKNEAIVRGLKMNTRYTVTVRCIHLGSVKNDYLPELYSEQNTKLIIHSTLDGNMANLQFDESALGLSLLSGANGYTGINASWGLTVGAFDHFRIYVKKKSLPSWPTIEEDCQTDYSDENSVICKKIPYNELTTVLTGLLPNTDYQARFAVCGENACAEQNAEGGSGRLILDFPETIRTTPGLASFEGIKTIALVTDLSELGAVSLGFLKPDFSSGYAEEYIVTVRRGSNGVFTTLSDEGEGLTLDPYDLNVTSNLKVRGLKFGEINDYCFRVQIKVGNTLDTNSAIKCVNVSGNSNYKISGSAQESNLNFLPPSSTTQPKEFAGLLNASVPQPSSDMESTEIVRLIWKKPAAGFYYSYDFYAASGIVTSTDLYVPDKKAMSLDAFYMDNFIQNPDSGQIYSEIKLPKGEKFSIGLSTGFPGLNLERNSCVWNCCPKITANDTAKNCDGSSTLINPNFKCFSSCAEQISVD